MERCGLEGPGEGGAVHRGHQEMRKKKYIVREGARVCVALQIVMVLFLLLLFLFFTL
jgi:hypothetical protein